MKRAEQMIESDKSIRVKKNKYTLGDIEFNIINYLVFGVFTLICVYPFYYLIINSISSNKLSANGMDDSMYVRALKFWFTANQMGLVDPESTT